ncbi:MAG: hypothetical protein RL341_1186 [Pseudomonadota bacterium]|jgi:hypothetical protein
MKVLGVDFSSAPTARKPITCAWGELAAAGRLDITAMVACATLDDFAAQLQAHGPWIGAFDFPFGLPRELVETLGWPSRGKNLWPRLIRHYAALSRKEIRAAFKDFCDARPAGSKFAHRAFDRAANSSPSMKWVNPPVAYMLHAGAPLLLAGGVSIPGMHQGDHTRIALEGYPALVARSVIGAASYKSDEKVKQTPERTERRRDIVGALKSGQHALGIKTRFACGDPIAMIEDGTADRLDAVLCCMQAAWAAQQPGYGLPAKIDPVEGFIITVPHG